MKKKRFLIPLFFTLSTLFFIIIPALADMPEVEGAFPDGDPSIGVPQPRNSHNYELSRGVDLMGYDKVSGEEIADYTVAPSNPAASEVAKQEKVKRMRKAIDPSEIRFRSGLAIRPQKGIADEVQGKLGLAEGYEYDYLLVQFGEEVKREIMDELEQAGAEFFDYVHYHAFYVRVPGTLLPQLETLSEAGDIRYVGPIPPEAKIEASLHQKVVEQPGKVYEVVVQLFEGESTEMALYMSAFDEIYSQTERAIIGKIDGQSVLELYAEPFVRWVEEWIAPRLNNIEGRMIHGADIVANLGSFTGDGVNVATMDTGIAQSGSTYHPDLPASRVVDQWDYQNDDSVANDDYSNGHGTHVAGSLGGEGNQNPEWVGMAPESNLHIYKLCCGTGQFSWFEDALQRASDNVVRAINNSWGGGTYGGYNSNAELADQAVRGDFGRYMNLVVASGNDTNLVNSPASAKNVITVGAVLDGNWPNSTISRLGHTFYVWPPGQIAPFSSYGPIDCDGNGYYRIKPDVVSTGPRTMSTVPWYLPAGTYYDLLDGTSMAAPKVTGLCALFLDAYPSYSIWPEMVKARMIASAINIGDSDDYGHGLVDAYHFIYNEPGIMENVLNVTGSVANNTDSKTYTFTVPTGFHEVRAVLTWPDPPGVEEAINDIDLYVRDADGIASGSSTMYDHVVEKVIATTGTPGIWEVEIDPFNLGSPAQTFALAVYVVMAPPSLDLNAWSQKRWVKPGEYFYFYTELENGGSPAPATYVTLNAPNGTFFDVLGGRLYPAEGGDLSEYYYDSDIHSHSDPSQNEYSMATGTVTGLNTPLVRWFIRVDPGMSFNGNTVFYAKGYARVGGSTIQRSVMVGIDDTPPINPTTVTSTSHSIGVWSTDRTIDMTWSGATDNVSGVQGYAWVVSTSPTTIPGDTIETTGTNVTVGPLGDSSNWYFHIKTIDNADNWNQTAVHRGPYRIDDTAPKGTIQINGGATQTTSLLVTLNLSATDNLSGVWQMQFSNNALIWSPWETYSTIRTNWDMSGYGGSATHGTKKVYARFRDAATNRSIVYSDRIVYLDTISPMPNPMTWATEPYGASTSSINMVATTATDDTPPVEYYFLCMTTDGNSSGWQPSTSYTDSGLTPNTWCGYRVMARDSAVPPNQTAYSQGSRYAYTLANAPGAAGFSNVTETSIRANWTANGNPAGTQYFCENLTAGTNSGWTTNTYWNSTGLSCGTGYSFRVKARNGGYLETGWTGLGTRWTLPCADACEGDFDGDKDVDGSDLAVFAADFGRTDCDTGYPCEGDFDHDRDVDGSDLAVFAADFGRTDCP